jgi:hypothetical protein
MDSKKVRGFKRLETLLQDERFLNELGKLHDLPDHDLANEDEGELTAGIYGLITRYKLLQTHFPILERLVAGNSLDEALSGEAEPVARIIDHNKRVVLPSDNPELEYRLTETVTDFKSGVTIRINSDISKDELVEFIKKNYGKLIKPSLTKRKKLTYERKSKRNNQIRNDKASGKSIADIEVENDINQSRTYKILKQK